MLLLVAGGGQVTARVLDRRGRESSAGMYLDDVAVWLTARGWRRGSGPVDAGDLYGEGVPQVLEHLWDGPRAANDRGDMSAVARQFAREVLRRG
ncbi:hypothetical protein [Microbacterium xanthum]|uniref:hypothetical protein n=1 Tax=Microbacterium xanthum TaxID=3079794 RepID=UPI002AD2AD64|nr:hypothetical protein [Microbacterium sp. KSW-48]MDZ8170768.1 hypothetical protein [Microbacterium sp. KSW-48]